ncbi:MAG: hypothetical protein E7418_04585 [Ruminococcaceae bacterium]|nr:hypothetical protein [Oscillospiraceae bacterium]
MDVNKIAKKFNISPSTVRKALLHERGVSPQTREMLFAAVGDEAPYAKAGAKPSVGIVLPTNPSYYWGVVYDGIKQALPREIDAHFAFFSSLGSGREGIYALDYIRQLDLCIVVPSIAPAVQAKIAALSAERPIVYVSDGLDTPRLATVHMDYYDDGFRLGKAYVQRFPDRKRILTLHVHNGLGSQMRTNGFKKAVTDAGCTIVGNIELEDITSPFASVIARHIHSKYLNGFDCLYCGTGATAYASLALSKLKTKNDVFCIGYENPKSNEPYIKNGMIRLLSVHNAFSLGEKAGEIAKEYLLNQTVPESKEAFIPSEIFINENGVLLNCELSH